jgi:hypothetical protein
MTFRVEASSWPLTYELSEVIQWMHMHVCALSATRFAEELCTATCGWRLKASLLMTKALKGPSSLLTTWLPAVPGQAVLLQQRVQ